MKPSILFPQFTGETFHMPVLHQVKLAAHHGFEISLICLIDKFEGPIHVAMIRERHSFMTIRNRLIHHGFDAGSTIQKGILRVAM